MSHYDNLHSFLFQLGCGMVALDYLVTVDSYPKPDDKIRSTNFQVQGGGNTGNAMTCAARLGLTPRIISKVAVDSQGKRILNELESDGIDTSFIVAHQRSIPIVIDAKRKIEGLDELLHLATYIVCSTRFPQIWTDAPSIAGGLISILLKLPRAKFVISTLGEKGCIMLERAETGDIQPEEVDIDDLFEKMKQSIDTPQPCQHAKPRLKMNNLPPVLSIHDIAKLHAKGIGTVYGRLLVETAEKIPSRK
ncbi:hypothetical protein KY285_033868 [Solanum tuberosum]|nr:hypothetical protein KY285_033868 [Solanum tuberosum]